MDPNQPHPLAATLAALLLGLAGVLLLERTPSPLDNERPDQAAIPLLERGKTAGPAPTEAPSERPRGRYREAELDAVAQLEAIGYLSGSREATDETSVTLHDPERAWQGLTLVTSGHAAEASLIAMDGEVLHTWALSFDEVWPQWAGAPNENMTFWRRVALLEDGGLLAIYEGLGLIRIDRESELVWARPNRAHHDLEVLPDGDILVLTRRVEQAEEVDADPMNLVDYVSRLGPDGLEKERISLVHAYAGSPALFQQWAPAARKGGDSFHTNTLHRLDGGWPAPFADGNLLLSMRHLNTLAVLDPEQRRIVWSLKGPWRLQHDPKILDNGNLLFFDNGPPELKASRAVELDRTTYKPVWSYKGTDEDPLWSATCGTVQRLPNGNTLITESDGGRALEVTAEGEVVWEYRNPHRPEDQPELVATLFEALRLPSDAPLDWLEAPDPDATEEAP